MPTFNNLEHFLEDKAALYLLAAAERTTVTLEADNIYSPFTGALRCWEEAADGHDTLAKTKVRNIAVSGMRMPETWHREDGTNNLIRLAIGRREEAALFITFTDGAALWRLTSFRPGRVSVFLPRRMTGARSVQNSRIAKDHEEVNFAFPVQGPGGLFANAGYWKWYPGITTGKVRVKVAEMKAARLP